MGPQWLSDLASSLWPLYSNVVPFPEATVLVRYMDSGYAVLIPYDCDKNHEPAMRKGHGAHWSLITGFLYVEDSSTVIREASTNLHVENEDAFYVFAHHGKSKHMGLWSYSTLRRSSMQMFEVGCQRSTCDFIVPVDGLDQMRGKCVLLAKEKFLENGHFYYEWTPIVAVIPLFVSSISAFAVKVYFDAVEKLKHNRRILVP
ncbi:hypothetical protein DICVIV_09781 [Dictyocaulus viviparus]|uniref:Actin maturation protease n=1 Tax=Dictyocaulus viviparus TaxID=29172 RepID=A0A0D8XK45_DICVI|nr:hypothetical protein DICVIV_09781 [Dictyocaulus viviparus]